MAEYLTSGQRAAFEAQLNAPSDALSSEQAQRAWNDGMSMAQADYKTLEDARLLEENGFDSVRDLLDAYQRVSAAVSELRETMNQLLDIERAAENAARLDPRDPEYAVRRRIEAELEPMRKRARQAARNRLIQQDWQDSAAQMEDLQRLLPEMAEYILRNPRYASESDGLMRAYDAVRSSHYRDEEALLADPAFIERAAEDERVRQAVLKSHLEKIMRNGEMPQSIGAGISRGLTPVTGKRPISGMEQARVRLAAMLGVSERR